MNHDLTFCFSAYLPEEPKNNTFTKTDIHLSRVCIDLSNHKTYPEQNTTEFYSTSPSNSLVTDVTHQTQLQRQ